MTWNAFHRRGETLRDVITLVDERRDGVLPWQAPGVAENFTDDLDLLGALLLKWHARLSGNLERALGREPVDLPGAVAEAWRTTAEQMPGVRLVVDRAAERAAASGDTDLQRALARAQQREWARLALAAGLASTPGPDAVAVGRNLEEQARARLAPLDRRTTKETDMTKHKRESDQKSTTTDAHDEANATLVERIKAALAAA